MKKGIAHKVVLITLMIGILSSEAFGQQSRESYREKLNQWHYAHKEKYEKVDSILRLIPKSKAPSSLNTGGTPTTYEFLCQDMFLSGANLAWNQFSGDIGFGSNPDITYFDNMFADIKAAGGNSIRWWLHTDAAFTPNFQTNGNCTGLHHSMTNQQIIDQMEDVLDAAYDNGILVDICLFSFDMLQDATNKGWTDIDVAGNRNFLTSSANVDSYINNALTPMVNALKDHPALLCWEVFNEPEGMASEHGWTGNQGGQFVSMSDIQMVVNKIAGAIHRIDNENPVTNGCWSFIAMSDIAPGATQNYYRDDRLIAAGGDADGTLDFYQVHYYTWAGTELSPFHHDADYWGLDKPIMVAEFHAEETFGVASDDLYDELFHRGYFGAWGWQYNESNLWTEIQSSMAPLYADHSAYIDFDKDNTCAGQPDCNGVIDGTAYTDNCGECVGGTTGKVACEQDCNEEWGGTASIDDCGVCSGGSTSITPNSSCNCDLIVEDEEICGESEVSLAAAGAIGTLQWYASATGGDPLATGATYSPTVSSSTTYYVIDAGQGTTTTSLGEPTQNTSATIWNIDDFDTGDKKIAITVTEEVKIDAVHVYPETNGTNVTVRIMDGTTVVGSGTVTGASGAKTRIPIETILQPGSYVIDAVGTSGRLEYQSELGTFPYEISGLISFTGNASWAINEGRYGLFYDWEIVQEGGEPTCDRTPVNVTVNTSGTWYEDQDNDGLGNPSTTQTSCDQPNGYVANADDTNDNDFDNDGISTEDDCNDNDENIGVATMWYEDADSDGLGNENISMVSCTQPAGYVGNSDDTNDDDADNDGVETSTDCDDNDSGVGVASIWYEDQDNDGLGNPSTTQTSCDQPTGYVANADDSNDNDADNDGISTGDDCNDNDENIGEASIWYEDTDNDGVGETSSTLTACTQPVGYVAVSGDECPNDINKTTPGECGCGETEESCKDCAGIPNGTAEYDDCGVCGGTNACVDCNGEPNGAAAEDACGTCAGGSTGIVPVTDPQNCIATGIEEMNARKINVYPNPFEQMTKVVVSGDFEVRVYDLTGAEVYSGTHYNEAVIGEGWNTGIYMVEIVGDNIHEIIKISKLK